MGSRPKIGGGGGGLGGVSRECARNELILVVDAGGDAVHGANESPLPHHQPYRA